MVPAPLTTGCTVNGTNVGQCCNQATISTSYDGYTTCTTTGAGVAQLQSCLETLLMTAITQASVSCTFNTNNHNIDSNTNSNTTGTPVAAAAAASMTSSGVSTTRPSQASVRLALLCGVFLSLAVAVLTTA